MLLNYNRRRMNNLTTNLVHRPPPCLRHQFVIWNLLTRLLLYCLPSNYIGARVNTPLPYHGGNSSHTLFYNRRNILFMDKQFENENYTTNVEIYCFINIRRLNIYPGTYYNIFTFTDFICW